MILVHDMIPLPFRLSYRIEPRRAPLFFPPLTYLTNQTGQLHERKRKKRRKEKKAWRFPSFDENP
ncbi:unnamed protein product [Tuber melanosporum]|uniref:(Perigord truffle) hypothetical protein n=1 Tax=Tuber melanosporum (strain Mel28) TaxID=656061 RepID=D5G887_TUBMM|nr:uncharacterized protein GSTUM_00002930001 [Tuber melanosporum]CAZ80730.1 unnamed protein product [Tuber melanosporum]